MIKLSSSKYRIACCLTEQGASDEDIAKKNNVCIATVKMHIMQMRNQILKETGVDLQNRLQLALFLIRNGFERKLTTRERRKQNG